MRIRLLVLGLALVLASPGYGCDVNLVTLISGESPDNAFAGMVITLASQTRAVGQNLKTPDIAQANLVTLMKTWVDFDNRFSQKPPEWARSDPQWSDKLKAMATQVGEISALVKREGIVDSKKVHQMIIALSGSLMKLFDTMPLSKPREHLRDVSKGIFYLTELKEKGTTEGLMDSILKLGSDTALLQESLATEARLVTYDFAFQVNQLKLHAASSPAELSQATGFAILVCEDTLAKMNAELIKKIK